MAHGSRTQYMRGCRCAGCTSAQRKYQHDWYQRRPKKSRVTVKKIVALAKKRALASAPHKPGSTSQYAAGCRCDGCRLAMRQYQRRRDGVKPENYRK